jgi:hypothetical protein
MVQGENERDDRGCHRVVQRNPTEVHVSAAELLMVVVVSPDHGEQEAPISFLFTIQNILHENKTPIQF